MKFALGRIVATPGALELLATARLTPVAFLRRHISGDWGDVPPEDASENDLSIQQGFRIVSSHPVAGDRLWIITEADRSVTTLLLPSEY
jgi:hypothetical protein